MFKDSAKQMHRWSKQSAQSVGLARNEYNELATTLGALLKNGGTPLDELAGRTDKLVGLGADLASMFGGTTREAVESLSSALKGEFNPIEKYGVTLRQSAIDAEAAALGYEKVGNSFDNNARQAATLSLVYKQTKDAQGNFARETDTFAHKQQVLNAEFQDAKTSIGKAFLPLATDAMEFLSKEGIPALENFADWLGENSDEIRDTAKAIGKTLLPPLETTVEVVGDAVKWFAELPEPVKKFGIEAGIAALILPKLTGAMGFMQTKTTGLVTSLTNAETRTQVLGATARNVAGVGGMLALAQGAQNADESTGKLLTTLGGAATGFALGGPWGALIGGAAGTAIGLFADNSDRADASVRKFEPNVKALSETYQGLAGRVTQSTRAMILQDLQTSGLLKSMRDLGIENRTLVDAALGNAGATEVVNKALARATRYNGGMAVSLNTNGIYMKEVTTEAEKTKTAWENYTGAVEKSRRVQERNFIATSRLVDLFPRLSKPQVAQIKLLGADPARKDVKGLIDQLDLTPKEVSTLYKVTGLDKMKGDISKAQADAYAGGKGIGTSTTDGARDGINSKVREVADAALNMVRVAINEARQEALIKSPSRKTFYIGQMLGRGAAKGIESESKNVANQASELADATVKALDGGLGKGATKAQEHFANVAKNLSSQIKSLVGDMRGLGDSISGNLLSGIFDTGSGGAFSANTTANSFKGNLLTKKAELTSLKGAVQKLRKWGLDPQFIGTLLQQPGGVDLITSLASGSRKDARQTANLYSQVDKMADRLGASVAGDVYGPKIEKRLRELEKAINRLPAGIGREINGAASKGKKKGRRS